MKSLIINVIILVTMAGIFCQCQKDGYHATSISLNGYQLIDCNVSMITDSVDFPLSNIIDECEMIPLETNDSSLFERVWHISISENYIAIHSYGSMPVKLFSRQGKFIRNIGSVGRGPGEFTQLYGIQLDEPGNRIYLTPFANAEQILVYNLNGELQPSIPLLFRQTKCKVYVENDIVTVLSMPFNDQIPIAYQQTISGELIQKLPVIDHLILRPDFSSEISSSHNADAYDIFILQYGGEAYDTLYHYNTERNKLIPKYVTSFNEEKTGSWTREFRRHYWTMLFGGNYANNKFIVDKKSMEAYFFRLINDFYGGFEIKNFFMSNDGMFVGTVPAFELIEEFEKELTNEYIEPREREQIMSLQETLDRNDNEILFVGRMK